jgi:hypothetical protein
MIKIKQFLFRKGWMLIQIIPVFIFTIILPMKGYKNCRTERRRYPGKPKVLLTKDW